ncbi:MAG TPA: VTT domain-containing protein, partial [Blastocatellia bacterium]|nr:VTT domain-containing protein [Blastocatellia bacterium]
VGTLISEDLTTIAVGVLVGQQKIGFAFGTIACLLGIFIGDLMLYAAGRWIGRPALSCLPLKWMIKPEAVDRSSKWFAERGALIITLSRFIPGMRLPTYFVAGLLNTSFWYFAAYFALAALIWTPLLVGISAWLGAEAVKQALLDHPLGLALLVMFCLALYASVRLAVRLASWRSSRLLIGKLRKLTRWEFWPPWAVYPPVVLYILYLALKYRSLTLFTCANPGIPASGFVGESKSQILSKLSANECALPEWMLLAACDGAASEIESRINQARVFMREHALGFPIVIKPDVGQRGADVVIAKSETELCECLKRNLRALILQAYVSGPEFGVFYVRYPNESSGHIFSITEKVLPQIAGDGESTLEDLILRDDRAVCLAERYLNNVRTRLSEIVPKDEIVRLAEIGSHCRGAIFLDGRELYSPELESAIERLVQPFDGFYFGRFDLRAASREDFSQGHNLKVIELNGVTSEATHIYDPQHSLFEGWRVLCLQWRLAFEIGEQNRSRGYKPVGIAELIQLIGKHL